MGRWAQARPCGSLETQSKDRASRCGNCVVLRLRRRSLIGGGALATAGALLGWRGARRAASAASGEPPLSTSSDMPSQAHLCLADPDAPRTTHAMSTVGDVDHARNGFDPHEILYRLGYRHRSRPCRMADGAANSTVTAVEHEVEIAPGVFFPAWTYNGRVPGPTLRATEGDRMRIHFANAGAHRTRMHFHGIHSARMDGVPGAGEICPGRNVRLRVRGPPVRLPPLSLPLATAEAPHPQRALRRLHHRSRPGAPPGAA